MIDESYADRDVTSPALDHDPIGRRQLLAGAVDVTIDELNPLHWADGFAPFVGGR